MGRISLYCDRSGAGFVAGAQSCRRRNPYSIGSEAMHHDVDVESTLSDVWNDHNVRIDG